MNDAESDAGNQGGPLAGQTVLVTRPAVQAPVLVQKIHSLGGQALVHPVIEILPAEADKSLESQLQSLQTFDVLVFASRNGVRFFQLALKQAAVKLPDEQVIVAIGSSTAHWIQEQFGLTPRVPSASSSQFLADYLIQHFPQQRLLLVRGDRGSGVLDNRLSEAGVSFQSVVAYRSTDVLQADPEILQLLLTNQIDWVTATSSSIGQAVVRLFGNWLASSQQTSSSRRAKLVSISPTTSAAIRAVGGRPLAEARTYNLDGLIEAMISGEATED